MNTKRKILIDTALTLFYQNSIYSVGINEILSVSGIAKKTLYHHFSGKEALVLATLEKRDQGFQQWLTTQLSGAKNDTEVIHQLFYGLTDWFHSRVPELGDFRGCFFTNTSAEFSDEKSAIAQYCRQHKQQVRQLIKQALKRQDEAFLDWVCLLKEGAISSAYVSQDLDAALKCIAILTASEVKY
ncbi:TetR/AcrR family transcriptional regulator [Marinomonas pollencensis]|uniref:TetR family transcriptional regulator n=1 Tax=Marinomonas pollencensis TaxID=491954 RepID=A0A3E0DXY7_9GAMM|nr:TetR/AcrR family transcriptional regulator [Marinomonas pollencensis]REG86951.1 TetR family transcriptional regulator [Marinomonas pollencensis]